MPRPATDSPFGDKHSGQHQQDLLADLLTRPWTGDAQATEAVLSMAVNEWRDYAEGRRKRVAHPADTEHAGKSTTVRLRILVTLIALELDKLHGIDRTILQERLLVGREYADIARLRFPDIPVSEVTRRGQEACNLVLARVSALLTLRHPDVARFFGLGSPESIH